MLKQLYPNQMCPTHQISRTAFGLMITLSVIFLDYCQEPNESAASQDTTHTILNHHQQRQAENYDAGDLVFEAVHHQDGDRLPSPTKLLIHTRKSLGGSR